MKSKFLLSAIACLMVVAIQAQEVNKRYVEVTGTSEIEIVPDKIHYLNSLQKSLMGNRSPKNAAPKYSCR